MTERLPEHETNTPRMRLPGDGSREEAVARMLRVDHAGEYGAARIYRGQLDVLGPQHPMHDTIREMEAQEKAHLETFDRMLLDREVRPTLLAPIWHVAGYALGAATALLGPRAAMACTAAVEEVIDGHYSGQIQDLDADEPQLAETLREFRADEIAHRDTALEHGAAATPGYELLSAVIKTGCRAAIWLSKRI